MCGLSVNSVPQVFSSRLQMPGKAQLQPSGVFTTIRLYRATRGPRPAAESPPPLPVLCLLSGSLSQNTRERRSGHQRNTPLLHTYIHKRKEETDVHLFPAVGSEMLYAARVGGSRSGTDSCYRMKRKTRLLETHDEGKAPKATDEPLPWSSGSNYTLSTEAVKISTRYSTTSTLVSSNVRKHLHEPL